jgi:galactonate dehydratase
MKIENITTVVVNACMRNWIFVKVQTDVPGLHGWGEATMEWKTRAVTGCIEDLKPMILGRDPTRVDFLWQILYRHSYFRLGSIGMTAISGIEQACCDILAKSLGVPVYKLLGGKVRDKVRMYTHLGLGETKAVYESLESSQVIERAQAVREQGYTALKVVCVPYSRPIEGMPPVKHFAKVIGDLRHAVGDQVDIMIDFHGRTTTGQATNTSTPSKSFVLCSARNPFLRKTPTPCSRFAGA